MNSNPADSHSGEGDGTRSPGCPANCTLGTQSEWGRKSGGSHYWLHDAKSAVGGGEERKMLSLFEKQKKKRTAYNICLYLAAGNIILVEVCSCIFVYKRTRKNGKFVFRLFPFLFCYLLLLRE